MLLVPYSTRPLARYMEKLAELSPREAAMIDEHPVSAARHGAIGALIGPFGSPLMERGHRMRHAGHTLLGHIVGTTGGALVGSTAGPGGTLGGAHVGGLLGRGIGGYYSGKHGEKLQREKLRRALAARSRHGRRRKKR